MIQIDMQKIERNKRTSEEIYVDIVARIKTIYKDKITETEASEAARNLIGFCQEILEFKLEKQRKQEYKQKSIPNQKINLIDL